MQNEFIQLISNHVLKEILESVTKSKYYSVILDFTPDVSRKRANDCCQSLVQLN